MKKNKFVVRIFCLSFIFLNIHSNLNSEIMIMSKRKSLKDSFIKNEYILDFEKSLMVRNYIYDNKTYKKHRITDLNIKKENSIERFLYQNKDLILTDKIGYPQFYTQLMFKKNNPIINIKTVINDMPAVSKISKCEKVEIFEKES